MDLSSGLFRWNPGHRASGVARRHALVPRKLQYDTRAPEFPVIQIRVNPDVGRFFFPQKFL